jgi:hypothetical protein
MNPILKVLTFAILAALILALPAPSDAADTAGAPATNPSTPTTNPDTLTGAARFYGPVSAVDPVAKTLTVDNVVYHVVAESHLTKATDDSLATLADAVVGEPARGSFVKSSDGKLQITKVRFGKKTGGKAGGGKANGGKKKEAASTQPQG